MEFTITKTLDFIQKFLLLFFQLQQYSITSATSEQFREQTNELARVTCYQQQANVHYSVIFLILLSNFKFRFGKYGKFGNFLAIHKHIEFAFLIQRHPSIIY